MNEEQIVDCSHKTWCGAKLSPNVTCVCKPPTKSQLHVSRDGWKEKLRCKCSDCEHVQELLHSQAKAYGGCELCYGKGFSTQLERASGSGDFEYHPIEVEMPYYLPCSCDRGKQIKQMELALRKKWLSEEIEKAKKMDFDIRKADKTPKYEYSRNRCDANRDGEFPDGIGARWAMPREISQDYVSSLQAELSEMNKEV